MMTTVTAITAATQWMMQSEEVNTGQGYTRLILQNNKVELNSVESIALLQRYDNVVGWWAKFRSIGKFEKFDRFGK